MIKRDPNNETEALILGLLSLLLENNSSSFYEVDKFKEHLLHRIQGTPEYLTSDVYPSVARLISPDRYRRDFDKHPGGLQHEVLSMLQNHLRNSEYWDGELDRHLGHLLDRGLFFNDQLSSERRELMSLARDTKENFTHLEKKVNRLVIKSENKVLSKFDDLDESSSLFEWQISAGVEFSKISKVRSLPARIYISDPVPSNSELNNIRNALLELCNSVEIKVGIDPDPESGSWLKRFIFRTKEAATHEEVTSRLSNAERALELKYLDKPDAEANKAQAEAAAGLIKALESSHSACIQVGSLLLVKATNNDGQAGIYSRTLTNDELKAIEENQSMLNKPDLILGWLEKTNGIKEIPKNV